VLRLAFSRLVKKEGEGESRSEKKKKEGIIKEKRKKSPFRVTKSVDKKKGVAHKLGSAIKREVILKKTCEGKIGRGVKRPLDKVCRQSTLTVSKPLCRAPEDIRA